jgi:peptidoglycan/LPS O-acetylase OafA/YrhL
MTEPLNAQPTDEPATSRVAPRLAYLDGLRGWMALVVVFSHLLRTWLLAPVQLDRYGARSLVDLFNWTPLGSMTDGIQAVFVFFAISGLAITYPILRSPQRPRTLTIMAVYRFPRLAVPVFASCLLAFVLLATGGFANAGVASRLADPSWFASLFDFPPDFIDMLKFAAWETWFPLQATMHSWNSVLWTMPVELYGSYLLFLLLALVRWRWLRLAIVVVLAADWWGAFNYAYCCGFFVGYCLAELLVAAERGESVRRRLATLAPLGWLCLLAALALSVWLQSYSFGKNRAYYMAEMNFIAALLVVGVVLVPTVRTWLSTKVSRFLGRISFALYLTHLLVICSFSSALFLASVDVLPYWLVVVGVGGLTVAVAMGVAWLFTLLVEERLLPSLKGELAALANAGFDALRHAVAGWSKENRLGRRNAS